MTGMFMLIRMFRTLLNRMLGEPWYQLCDDGKQRSTLKCRSRSRRKSPNGWTLVCA
jgi:hypothetical protein